MTKVGFPQATKAHSRDELSLLLVGVFDGLLRFGGLLVFLGEALDAAGRIQQLLLAGKERVAIRANLDAQKLALHRRSRRESMPAGAMHGYRMVVRMNVGFHGRSPAGWPVCAAPGHAPGLQSRRLVSGQFSIIRDSPGPANMIYMRAGNSFGCSAGRERFNDGATDDGTTNLPGGGENADPIESEIHAKAFAAHRCCSDSGRIRFRGARDSPGTGGA
jgi:hypothetical protein